LTAGKNPTRIESLNVFKAKESTMSLIFYYSPMSTATLTDLVLEELGVSCKKVKLSLKDGDTRKPDFLKLNPNAKVPVIVHDDIPIFESAAITMYLGEVFGVEKKLYPAPGPKRGEAMKWIVWTNVTLGEAVYNWCRNTMEWAPADHRNEKAGQAAQKDIAQCLGILNQELTGKKYLLGDTYTLADTHVNSYLDWLRHMKVDFTPFTNLNAWSKSCSDRPAYVKQMSSQQ
jgi:glutathione S-transferase